MTAGLWLTLAVLLVSGYGSYRLNGARTTFVVVGFAVVVCLCAALGVFVVVTGLRS